MKKLMFFILLTSWSLSYSWELEGVMESEGVQTNLVKCNNGATHLRRTTMIVLAFLPMFFYRRGNPLWLPG